MARTWAQANTERLRLLNLGRRLSVKVVKNPVRGSDAGGVWPGGAAVADYMLLIKDPRPTGGPLGEGANQGTSLDMGAAILATRWHGDAQEHITRARGLIANERRGGAAPNTHWLLYGAGEAREAGAIPDSAVIYA